MIKLKTCVSCKKEKPKTDEFFFYRNKEKGYLSSWCKDCRVMNREKTWGDELEAQRKRRRMSTSVAKRCADCAKIHKAKEKRESKCIYKRRVRVATPSWEDKNAIKEFYKNCPDGFHVDHIIPLRGKNVTGLHTLSNLQYLSKEENMRKSNIYNLDEN